MDIDINDIEIMNPDEGGGSIYWYQGQPFTGKIVEFKNNILIGEISVVNSHTEGRVAFYYDNGQMESEYSKSLTKLMVFTKDGMKMVI